MHWHDLLLVSKAYCSHAEACSHACARRVEEDSLQVRHDAGSPDLAVLHILSISVLCNAHIFARYGGNSLLVRHDESAPDIAVLHKAFPVRQPKVGAHLDSGWPGAVWDRHHTVYVLHQIQAPAERVSTLQEMRLALQQFALEVGSWDAGAACNNHATKLSVRHRLGWSCFVLSICSCPNCMGIVHVCQSYQARFSLIR